MKNRLVSASGGSLRHFLFFDDLATFHSRAPPPPSTRAHTMHTHTRTYISSALRNSGLLPTPVQHPCGDPLIHSSTRLPYFCRSVYRPPHTFCCFNSQSDELAKQEPEPEPAAVPSDVHTVAGSDGPAVVAVLYVAWPRDCWLGLPDWESVPVCCVRVL